MSGWEVPLFIIPTMSTREGPKARGRSRGLRLLQDFGREFRDARWSAGLSQAVVARELTKTFEELRRGTLYELAAHYRNSATPKGEIVICIGPPLATGAAVQDVDGLLMSLAAEMPASKAAAEAAKMTGLGKPDLYRRLIELKAGRDG